MAILVGDKVTPEQIIQAGEDCFGEYIKIVVDIESGTMTFGGEWYADGEKMLLENGSKQADLWGGGLRLANKQIDFNSLINTRSGVNQSQEILDPKIRVRFEELVKTKFALSPFAENLGRKPVDECEELSASEGFRSRRSGREKIPRSSDRGAS